MDHMQHTFTIIYHVALNSGPPPGFFPVGAEIFLTNLRLNRLKTFLRTALGFYLH
jgi:hypothetical protein